MSEENLDEILADVKKEGSDPFEQMGETPSDSLPEKEAEDTPVVEDENVPFHKHPRWIERENELNALKENNEATARELEELKQFRDSVDVVDSNIPDWFTELYGDNAEAYRKYQQHEDARTEEIEKRILERQTQEQQRAEQESAKWTKWVEDEIRKLEDDGKKFDRNKLNKIMLDYSPTDANNNLDYQKGYAIYEALEGKPDNSKSEARKELADTATATSTKGEPTKKDYMTPSDLRHKSWGSL